LTFPNYLPRKCKEIDNKNAILVIIENIKARIMKNTFTSSVISDGWVIMWNNHLIGLKSMFYFL